MRLIDSDKLIEDVKAHCGVCGEAIECVLTAPTIEPASNPPLTLEELRKMDGEPVWVCNPEDNQWGHWALVREDKSDGPEYNHGVYAVGLFWWFLDYGKTWVAYRRKPEE